MKGIFRTRTFILSMLTAVIILGGFPLTAQENTFSSAEGDYYRVYVEGGRMEADETARRLDAYAEIFEGLLHYSRTELPGKLRVRIFGSREPYVDYLADSIGEPKDSFVFLRYSEPNRSELVGYTSGPDFEESLIHHAFVQYLKTFIPTPPLWLQKGGAIYLEKIRYIPGQDRAEYRQNLSWLKSLKTLIALGNEIIPVSTLLTLDVETANRRIESFYAQSWGLAHFLLNTDNKEYTRIFWDSISVLSEEASRQENEAAVIDKCFSWVNKDRFLQDFVNFMTSVRTFSELVEAGIAAYNKDDHETAEKEFTTALERRSDHYIPYYYLGLIRYAEEDYSAADYLYSEALEQGALPGLIYYAKGITAYSEGDTAAAREHLKKVVEENSPEYGEKAQELLTRIEDEETDPGLSGPDDLDQE